MNRDGLCQLSPLSVFKFYIIKSFFIKPSVSCLWKKVIVPVRRYFLLVRLGFLLNNFPCLFWNFFSVIRPTYYFNCLEFWIIRPSISLLLKDLVSRFTVCLYYFFQFYTSCLGSLDRGKIILKKLSFCLYYLRCDIILRKKFLTIIIILLTKVTRR